MSGPEFETGDIIGDTGKKNRDTKDTQKFEEAKSKKGELSVQETERGYREQRG